MLRILSFFILMAIAWTESSPDQSSSKATQLIRVSYGLKDNYEFLRILNSTVTNRGTEDQKKYYKRCIQHHIESEILHLQMDLGRSYAELRRTQGLLIRLYILILDEEVQDLEVELSRLARLANGKEKTETKLYLRLGYREIAVAKQRLMVGKNIRPYLYLMKLQELAYSLKSLKQAEKYIVLLGLLHDSIDDFNPEERSFPQLVAEVNRIIVNDTEKYLKLLYDSQFDSYGAINFYESVWKQPDMFELAQGIPNFDPSYVRNPVEATPPADSAKP
ncbi:adhesin OmpL37 family surface protein [Leptospira sp. 'Mane']|uniref:adhesin OmpL37 family surface protein n=1 Tax=Leptospira sp. 'Mane' TaxID=3387407 RepID=UPI00398AFEE5